MKLLDAIATESVSAFTAEFAEEVEYTPSGGVQRSLFAIFDRASDVTDIGEMIQRDGLAAVALVADSLVPEMARGDVVTARGVTYSVIGHEPDGTGMTRVELGI